VFRASGQHIQYTAHPAGLTGQTPLSLILSSLYLSSGHFGVVAGLIHHNSANQG